MSALHDFSVDVVQKRILELLPLSPPYFEKDALTDKPARFFVNEIIREKALEISSNVPSIKNSETKITSIEEALKGF